MALGARSVPRTSSGGSAARSAVAAIAMVGVVIGVFSIAGCEEGFEAASSIRTLRVMGVQADAPYPRPGETVALRMLWHDGGSPVDESRDVQIMWIGGCFNPPGDLFYACFSQLADRFASIERDPSLVDQLFGFGDTFNLDIPSDLVSGRPVASGQEPYGLTFVFFAACAGDLRAAEPGDDGIPFGCFDKAGNRLGTSDYVPGYLSLYSFAERTNANPVLNGFLINEELVDPDDVPTFPRCTKDSCPELSLRVLVDPASVEQATGMTDASGNPMSEQMWVEYLATAGSIDSGPRLVNDATRGFNEDNATDYEPPGVAGKQYFFAIVRDNRGGVAWVKQGVMFE